MIINWASGGIGIRAGLRNQCRLRVESFLPTRNYESRSKIKKGLRTILSVIVEKEYSEKNGRKTIELQKVF